MSAGISQVMDCKDCLQNDLHCVGWVYTPTPSPGIGLHESISSDIFQLFIPYGYLGGSTKALGPDRDIAEGRDGGRRS